MQIAEPERVSHPRVLGWVGTSALAMGGSNQSLFVLAALLAAQGTAAVPLLVVGLLLSWAAAPGWTELILMWPNRVGGIAASCAEAFRPYSPVLANLTGVCYWWGWVPTCGLTAILSASALHAWYLPGIPVSVMATVIIAVFTGVNLCGIKWVVRLAVPVAACSALLALASGLIPILSGTVNWHRAFSFHLTVPFHGAFGAITSAMAGLYLIGFAAPAFEAAACHVGETRDPARNIPRAMLASGGMASIYFVLLPVVWLGVIGGHGLGGELTRTLGPTYAPLLGGAAKATAVWFMVLNMFHGTLQPLAGAARTLSQLSQDGLLPRLFARRNRRDVPWVATVLTAAMSILFLQSGDPPWVIAAANLAYLIGIGLPSVAVWLLRRNAPQLERPFRAPRGTIGLGLIAAGGWGLATILGFEQFGLPTVLAGLGLAYAGSGLYAWRAWRDRRAEGRPRVRRSLHLKLTGAMLAVVALDATGYLLAVAHVPRTDLGLVTLLADIFVVVAVLSIVVGLVLPGMIAHASRAVSSAATRMATGTVADLTRAMEALARGDLDAAHARLAIEPLSVQSRDEVGEIAQSFNVMRDEVARAADALDGAREGLRAAELRLERNLAVQAAAARLGQRAIESRDVEALVADAVDVVGAALGVQVAAWLELDVTRTGAIRISGQVATADATAGPLRAGSEPLHRTIAGRTPIRTVNGRHLCLADELPRDGLLAPIHVGGQPCGLLAVYDVPGRRFTPEEFDFLHMVGIVLAEAIRRMRTEAEVRHTALHDPLTGLPNRVLLLDRLSHGLARAGRDGSAVAVLFLDLDHFKFINDSLGHNAGDDVLRHVAGLLTESLRPGDTVARLGGDEFVMVCTDLGDPGEAPAIAARVADLLRRPFHLGEVEHRVITSIGVATAHGTERGAEEMIAEADAAMYRAKDRGRDRHEVYDAEMHEHTLSRLQIASELPAALHYAELRVEFQPIVRIEDEAVIGAEALVRWAHPERGEISPADFIPVAEEIGAIVPIGEFVLKEACRTAAGWRRDHPEQPIFVSVNLSLRQARYAGLPEFVAAVLAETGLEPSALHLEITESVLMEETEPSMRCLFALKALGVSLVLDDFGTGYSSLAYVKRFPIDTIKIDRTFVSDLSHDNDTTIVEAIVNMAHGLRLDVIAEGVETEAQASRLSQLHCGLAQGWLYAPALPAAALARRFAPSTAPAPSPGPVRAPAPGAAGG